LKAIALDQWNAEAYVGLGLLYKKEGLLVKARKQLEKAVSIDPDHKVALRELRDSGETKKKTWKSILEMDLFKKKK
jgi:tetratricopeptide (TPR) repeat protein